MVRRKGNIKDKIASMIWYHTLDLGNGIFTPGHYDHRPYLHYYGIPENLSGKSVLDIGTASGFFAFEMEKRGATVTATDIKKWREHDFGRNYKPDHPEPELKKYLHEPFRYAKRTLGSKVKKKKINIYDISPAKLGCFDIVFCSSVLVHLMDPVRALHRIQSITRELAIIATVIHREENKDPLALFSGHLGGSSWWFPNKTCLEAMIQSAGFSDWKWFSEFRLDYSDGRTGTPHGVIHAWNNK